MVGMTVVSLGTSAPELAVSISSAAGGDADLALGNAIGSNIANVLLILGLSAVVAPLVVRLQLVRVDVPVMIGTSILLVVLALDRTLSRLDGLILVTLLVCYLFSLIRRARGERNEHAVDGSETKGSARSALMDLGRVVVGM